MIFLQVLLSNMIIYYILYITYHIISYIILYNIIIISGLCIWKCEKALIGLLAPRFNISAIKGTSAVGLGRNFQPFLQPHFYLFFLTSYFHSYLFLCHDFFDKILIFFILLSVLAMWMGPSIRVHLPMFLQTTSLHTRTPFPTNEEGCWRKWR